MFVLIYYLGMSVIVLEFYVWLKRGIVVKVSVWLLNGRKIIFLNVNKSCNLLGKLDVVVG